MNTGPRKNYCKKRIDQKGTRHDLISILKRSGSECLWLSTARLAGILRQGICSRSFALWHIKAGDQSKRLRLEGNYGKKGELIYVFHEQEGYLQIAKECYFEATDKFRSMDSGNKSSGKNWRKKWRVKERFQEHSVQIETLTKRWEMATYTR